MIEQTLVLLKPDAIQRAYVGQIISRFEKVGLKVIGMKMVWMDKEFGKKHYFDVANRRGEKVLKVLLDFMTIGPVIAMVLEGIHAVEIVRKIVGPTEPRKALPGTIRGDFSQHAYDYNDLKEIAVKNLVHASGNVEEAKKEVELWFNKKELHTYKTVHETHVL